MPNLRVLLASLSILVCACTGPRAQRVDDFPLEVSFTSERAFYRADATVSLTLALRTTAAVEVPASLLHGRDLECFVDGKPVSIRNEPSKGVVKLAPDVRFERRMTIDLKEVLQGEVKGTPHVALKLRDLPKDVAGAFTVSFRVVGDQASIDVDAIDLAKARVRFVTSKGDIVFSFFPDKAPGHVKNFIKLSKDGFYNNTRFHRVIRGQIIQGGCPNTRPGATGVPGTGSPGYTIDAEINDTRHVRGILSMARGNNLNTAGSQFFICHGNMPNLDPKPNGMGYTAFGRVVSGFDAMDALAATPVVYNKMRERSQPVEPLHLHLAVVEFEED